MPSQALEKSKKGKYGPFFSVKTGTSIESSNLFYQYWMFALFLNSTHLKSVSIMKLHRDITVKQHTAGHMAHRIRNALGTGDGNLFSPKHVHRYVDEFGGRRNARDLDTLEQVASIATDMEQSQLGYKDLVGANRLASGARMIV